MSEGKISWKESNLSLIGSDLDKKIKEAAAAGEEAWQGIGDEPGVKVWRVEQFKIVPWPEDDYGCFYTGDSYIVLNSYLIEDKLYRDLYIWIGSESSQDEYGTAAYKVISLLVARIVSEQPFFSNVKRDFRWLKRTIS